MMKDRDFLLTACLVSLTLIFSNFSLFIKSLASSQFLDPSLKKAAQQLNLDGFRASEQEFWSRIKEVDYESPNRSIVVAKTSAKVPPSPSPQKVTSKGRPTKPKSKSQPKSQPEKPYTRFLMVGDSIMFDVGIQLQSKLQKNHKVSDTKLDYKVSSGLNRIDYYDWYARTEKLLKTYKPDVLFIMFGGNDAQDITDFEGNYWKTLTEDWKKAYRERVEKYAQLIASSSVRKVYWIGQPIARKSRTNKFFTVFNEIYRDVSQNYPKFKFISTWNKFAVEGQFTPVLKDRSGKRGYVKAGDGIHFTSHGAKIVSELAIERLIADKVVRSLDSKNAPLSKK